MAQSFDAGAIFVSLRTKVKEWREGFKQAGTIARRFGDTMRRVGARLKAVGRTHAYAIGKEEIRWTRGSSRTVF